MGFALSLQRIRPPHYTMGRGEIEIIARHMGLIPETVKDPAPPEITKEQHFAIWHSAFTRSFNPMNGISPAIDYADAAVAAFRGSLRKGVGNEHL